jgi:hypothetical protein
MTPLDLVLPVSDLIGKVIDRVWPDKITQASERAKAELALHQLTQEGELKVMAQQMSAILAEAQSADPWTSRARPSFLYVMYAMILFSVPMGFVAAFKPELAAAVATGMKAWLDAIPNELYTLFGVGYLGYAATRSWDKTRGLSK